MERHRSSAASPSSRASASSLPSSPSSRDTVLSTAETIRETWACRSSFGDSFDEGGSDVADWAMDEETSKYAPDPDIKSRSVAPPTLTKPRLPLLTIREKAVQSSHTDSKRGISNNKQLPLLQPIGKAAPTPTTDGLRRKKLGQDDDTCSAKKKAQDDDIRLKIYAEYDREGLARDRLRQPFALQHPGSVYAAIFTSTATIHCVALNISPAIFQLFSLQSHPVGICLIVSWIFFDLACFVGGYVGNRVADRIVLLRRASVLWAFAIVMLHIALLSLTRLLEVIVVAIGFLSAIIAHGIIIPNVIALGLSLVPEPTNRPESDVDQPVRGISQHALWCFGASVGASNLVQAFYFAAVDLNSQSSVLLRSRRALLMTLTSSVLLLVLIAVFLFQSRDHQPTPPTQSRRLPASIPSNAPALERKLAGELQLSTLQTPPTVSFRAWGRLYRRPCVFWGITFFAALTLLGVGSCLITHLLPATSQPRAVHLATLSMIFVGWFFTTLFTAGQVSSQQVKSEQLRLRCAAIITLLSLATASIFVAFVRAQLYTAMFIQACQLRPSSRATAFLVDPRLLGVTVGVISLVTAMALSWLVRQLPLRLFVAPLRRASIGVMCYLLAVFVSSVVELYRRNKAVSDDVTSLTKYSQCPKVRSDFSVWWIIPHLVLLALADALFRVAYMEEVYALTQRLKWESIGVSAQALADAIGYTTALALSSALSPWLYRHKTSDLVMLFLLVAALASLLFALTRRLAEKRSLTQEKVCDTKADGEAVDNQAQDIDVEEQSHSSEVSETKR